MPCRYHQSWTDSRWWCSNGRWTDSEVFGFRCPREWQFCLNLLNISNGCLARTWPSWSSFYVQSKWTNSSCFRFCGPSESYHLKQLVWAAHHTSNQLIEWAHYGPWWWRSFLLRCWSKFWQFNLLRHWRFDFLGARTEHQWWRPWISKLVTLWPRYL